MKLKDLLTNIEYILLSGTCNKDIQSITIDSRKVKDGSLFVCIGGLTVDGHEFARDAFEKGASAIMCDKDLTFSAEGLTLIKVKNSREAIALVAGKFYNEPAEAFNLIGITGTNGKTSSTYFMECILKEYNKKVGVIGTVEIRADGERLDYKLATSTTPDAVELQQIFSDMKKRNITDVVMEVSSHALELHKVGGCRFLVSVFTNLTQDHLDFHLTMDNYIKAKAKLFEMSRYGVINLDDKHGEFILKNGRSEFLTYSIEKDSDLKAENIEYSMDGVKFTARIDGEEVPFILNIPGRFSVYNALGVIGASLCLKIPVDIIRKGIANIKPVPGRIQAIKNDLGFNVIVDYAHTPDGLFNIINSVREFTKGRVITVFGCGGDRDKTKRPIMGEISGRLSDYTILTSDNPRSEEPESIICDIANGIALITKNYACYGDRREAIFKAVQMAEKEDSVIIAGKGHESYEIFADHIIDFDDTLVAAEALERMKK